VNGKGLTIGTVATRVGVRTKVIRFYEAAGIIAPPPRGANGYRLYAPEAINLLRFIKQAQELGLTLGEIKEIVAIRQGGRPPCRHVYRLLQEKGTELDEKIEDLLLLRRKIRQSLAAWGKRGPASAAVCPHIEAPAATGGRGVAKRRR
jgi:DNA-binding transcriptional MerR regulator